MHERAEPEEAGPMPKLTVYLQLLYYQRRHLKLLRLTAS